MKSTNESRNPIEVTYKGKKFPSVSSLYRCIAREYRLSRHRKFPCRYDYFLILLNRHGVDEGVAKARAYKPREILNLRSKSMQLKGAENLVCQRMTKLGWSYERAVSTPVCTKNFPMRVKYKGKIYPSINACFRAVNPDCSITLFTKQLKKKKCILKK